MVRPSGDSTTPFGKARSRRDTGRAIELDPDEHRERWSRVEDAGGPVLGEKRLEVEPEVSDPGGAVGSDHHVVAVKRRQAGQVGVLGQPCAVPPQHPPVEHRDHQQRSIGEPAETRWLALDLDDPLIVALEVDCVDRPVVEVAAPEPPVVPARPLTEVQALVQHSSLAHGGERI
jgi:hypothetical protein